MAFIPPIPSINIGSAAGAMHANQIARENTSAAQAFNALQAQKQMEYQTMSAEKAMKFSAEEAEKNRKWQEAMANTAYQRAVADLKKAGLNPILAYQQGGASVGSGSTAQGVSMTGASGQTSAAQTFAGDWITGIFETLANSAEKAMNEISSSFISPKYNKEKYTNHYETNKAWKSYSLK